MFTGIVEELGSVAARDGGRFRFRCAVVSGDAAVGDSIAVNGCCLTVVACGDGWWEADAVDETLRLTNLDALAVGDPVNLERPVRVSDRLGGHIVQGHVDGVGTVVRAAPELEIAVTPDLLRYMVPKGSVTVDGCSLTLVTVGPESFTIAIIPHTEAVTTLGRRRVGEQVNVEVDVVAKYVERLAGPLVADRATGAGED